VRCVRGVGVGVGIVGGRGLLLCIVGLDVGSRDRDLDLDLEGRVGTPEGMETAGCGGIVGIVGRDKVLGWGTKSKKSEDDAGARLRSFCFLFSVSN
jgi:hypothetical protein